MAKVILTVFLLSLFFIQEARSQICHMLTCDECISAKYSCAWCTQTNFTGARCGLTSDLVRAGCGESFIENPSVSTLTIVNEDVRDSSGIQQAAIQIQPQKIKIRTRPRMTTSLPLTFRAANNFPVDLYFLYDVSISMQEAIINLAKLSDDIEQSIGDISSNYRMGYGIFQDKAIMPYTDTSPNKMLNPCSSKKVQCAQPFEYQHVLNMTKDTEKFKDAIKRTNLTGNADHPEGSLDALMQAITCKTKLGWRGVSRKLLIFSSNAPFHSAGAGRLAGIVTPNDGKCHLNGKGQYAMELLQDYPSVGQVTHAVKSNEMHVIFIVPKSHLDLFTQLSNRIPQSTAGELGDPSDVDNKNIKNIIENKYKEMISEVEIVHNNITGVEIKIAATSDECQVKGTNKCKGLKIGTEIKFSVEISVTSCPAKKEDRKPTLIFHPKSMKHDKLVIELEIVCECDCTKNQAAWVTGNDVCTHGNGTEKCGICECNKDRFGSKCECDSTEADALDSDCINSKSNSSSLPCSGHGSCKCGQCTCDLGYSGQYCECYDKGCKSFQREVCGGIRGYCACGECVCEKGYTGEACKCPTSNTTCIQNGFLCSEAGTCDCGVCKCETGYTGKFCEDCFRCGEGACDIQDYRACAECVLINGDKMCQSKCPDIKPKVVDKLSESETNACALKQDDDCFLKYTAENNDGNVTLYVQKTKVCPTPVDIVPIVIGVVAGVVACGILLLIVWKILTTMYDRMEYSKFQDDLKNCKWAKQDNPVYKGATTTYKNPLVDSGMPPE